MNLALFDFDGTITYDEMYTPFIKYTTPKIRLKLARLIITPFLLLNRFGFMSAPKLRYVVTFVTFFGRCYNKVNDDGALFAKEVIPLYLRSNAMKKLEWHLSQGDEVVVVSASLHIYLYHWCQHNDVKLICSELSVVNSRLTGLLKSGDCSNVAKSDKVKAQFNLSQYNKIYAYGDTDEDLDMLDLACEKYMNWEKLTS
ncbi:hypothetical protein CJF42_23545 [Pseudoalteromonas sp. NBT06-2]|uniref:HAD-IB family phosphatase n=1 Tax=Pseudoalteromonas sp. NBT06-2 TaxID=2025950 RepID=UPI000BA6D810|nr:HAD-IB family phosphatase [Pseudoalteromonas sp. NBT06-2]PAJ72006.1 hypothetical protein CJF42_23545 [Pseudoalteromonas sp. NBT06-2]